MNQQELTAFIVRAKAATYVGGGEPSASCRSHSHDLQFTDGDWTYLDSYFGGQDFMGEEIVYHRGRPVWGMNYYGYILEPDKISAAEAGQTIKASLSRMYQEGRFLGGFRNVHGSFVYEDNSIGGPERFTGHEIISKDGIAVYTLHYHGGLILDS